LTANIVSKRQAAAEPPSLKLRQRVEGGWLGRSVAAGHDGPAGPDLVSGGHLPGLSTHVAVVADRRNRSILGRIASSPNRSQDSRHGSIAVIAGA
jgi:hypothetical protein